MAGSGPGPRQRRGRSARARRSGRVPCLRSCRVQGAEGPSSSRPQGPGAPTSRHGVCSRLTGRGRTGRPQEGPGLVWLSGGRPRPVLDQCRLPPCCSRGPRVATRICSLTGTPSEVAVPLLCAPLFSPRGLGAPAPPQEAPALYSQERPLRPGWGQAPCPVQLAWGVGWGTCGGPGPLSHKGLWG